MSKDRKGSGELRDGDVPEDRSLYAPIPGDEPRELAGDPAFAGVEVADIFRRLLSSCLPASKAYGGARRFRAAYTRMVAIAYCVAPEQFDGMTQGDVAAFLGVTPWAFRKQLATVGPLLAARHRRPR